MTLKDVLKAVFTFENVNAVITAALAAVLFMLLLYIGILLWGHFSAHLEIPDMKTPYRRRVKPKYSFKWRWEAVS